MSDSLVTKENVLKCIQALVTGDNIREANEYISTYKIEVFQQNFQFNFFQIIYYSKILITSIYMYNYYSKNKIMF